MTADGFDDAVLGRGLGAATEAALAEAGRLRSLDPPGAMAALMRAQVLAPGHPAVLIAFYRHHFYGHRPAAARDLARRALMPSPRGRWACRRSGASCRAGRCPAPVTTPAHVSCSSC